MRQARVIDRRPAHLVAQDLAEIVELLRSRVDKPDAFFPVVALGVVAPENVKVGKRAPAVVGADPPRKFNDKGDDRVIGRRPEFGEIDAPARPEKTALKKRESLRRHYAADQ